MTLQEAKDKVAQKTHYGYDNWQDMKNKLGKQLFEMIAEDRMEEVAELYADAKVLELNKCAVSGNEAMPKKIKENGEVAVAFAKWIAVYASQLGNGWVIMKGTEPTMQTTEQLYDEFQKAKATDR